MLADRLTARKMRLFACACCRQIWNQIGDAGSRARVELAESFADGLTSDRQRQTALAEAKAATDEAVANRVGKTDNRWQWFDAVRQTLEKDPARHVIGPNAAWILAQDFAPGGVVTGELGEPYLERAEAMQADLVRDVFGNPFRKAAIKKRWLTDSVRQIAECIYREQGYDRLSTLGDALLAGGCNDEQIIAHCRSKGPHVRGCCVVDMILGKE
jgi:hypothetical protein